MKKYIFPRQESNDPEERHLSKLLSHYVTKTKDRPFDQEFVTLLQEKFNFKYRDELVKENKQNIIKWIEKHQENGKYRFPSRKSKNLEEKRLAGLKDSYTCKSSNYDQAFVDELWEKFNFKYLLESIEEIKTSIDRFITKRGYFPSSNSKNLKEIKLKQSWDNCSFDEDFLEKYKNVPTWQQYKTNEVAKEVIVWSNKYGRSPTTSRNADRAEKKLGSFIHAVKSGLITGLQEDLKKIILSMKTKSEVRTEKTGLPPCVYKYFNKFGARTRIKGKQVFLGYFNTIEEANAAVEATKKTNE